MARNKTASVAEDADYDETTDANGDARGYRCEHCGARVVHGYDGRGSGWGHIYGDGRDGEKFCE